MCVPHGNNYKLRLRYKRKHFIVTTITILFLVYKGAMNHRHDIRLFVCLFFAHHFLCVMNESLIPKTLTYLI